MKINNTQRAGMVRQLEEVKKKIESSGRSWYSYSKYGGYSCSGDDNAEARAVVAELEDKLQLTQLKQDEKRIERAVDSAVAAVEKGLKRFNDAKETERQDTLKQLVFGIRDTWASETIEDAKAIVERFVQ